MNAELETRIRAHLDRILRFVERVLLVGGDEQNLVDAAEKFEAEFLPQLELYEKLSDADLLILLKSKL